MTRAASAPERRETRSNGKEAHQKKRGRPAAQDRRKNDDPESTTVPPKDDLSSPLLDVQQELASPHKKRRTEVEDTIIMAGARQLSQNTLFDLSLSLSLSGQEGEDDVDSDTSTQFVQATPDHQVPASLNTELFEMKQREHEEVRRAPITRDDLDGEITDLTSEVSIPSISLPGSFLSYSSSPPANPAPEANQVEQASAVDDIVDVSDQEASPVPDDIEDFSEPSQESKQAAAIAAAAACAVAEPANLNECCVCGRCIRGFKGVDYATHLRTHPKETYSNCEAHLTKWFVALCPVGGEARPMKNPRTKAVFAHKCKAAGDEQKSFPRPATWGEELPWPANTPYPPSIMPHPLKLDFDAQVLRRVPDHAVEMWGDVVCQASTILADAVEQGGEDAIAIGLQAFLGMSTAIERTRRTGKRHGRALTNQVRRYLEKIQGLNGAGDDSSDSDEDGSVREEKTEERKREEEDKREEDDRAVREAGTLTMMGYDGKAAKVLRSNDVVNKATEETANFLQTKFPSPRTNVFCLNPVAQHAPRFMMELEGFVAGLRAQINGSAGGRSGLTGEHFKPLLDREDVMEALLRVHRLIINGELPKWAHPYIVSQRLMSLGAKQRPICMGEFIARSCAAFVNATVSAGKDETFFLRKIEGRYVCQFANSISGGTEAMAHLIHTLVHDGDRGMVVVSDDGKNAYGALDRVNGCNVTTKLNPSTHRWINWAYGTPAMMVHGDRVLWGQEGSYQGDPLGGRIHDTAFQPVLEEASRLTATQFPLERVHVLAFRDDAYVVGPATASIYCHRQIKRLRKEKMNVDTAEEKIFAYCPVSSFLNDEPGYDAAKYVLAQHVGVEKVHHSGFTAVGIPISEDSEFLDDFLQKCMEKYPKFLPRIEKGGAKTGIKLLRSTHLPIATHLMRGVHPYTLKPHARAFDTQIHSTYSKVTGDTTITRDSPKFRLPTRLAGMGMRSVEMTSPIAYFASTVAAMEALRRLDDASKLVLGHFAQREGERSPHPEPVEKALKEGIPALVTRAWEIAYAEIFAEHPSDHFPGSVDELFEKMAAGDLVAYQLQKLLTAEAENAWAAKAQEAYGEEEKARTEANKIRGSSSLFTCTPTHALACMSDEAYTNMLKARTNTLNIPLNMCTCGQHTTTFAHLLSCKHLLARTVRHDIIVRMVCNLLISAGKVARTEVRVVNGTQKRMDVVVYTASKTYWIDVSVVNPMAPSYVKKKDPIKIRENTKRARWQSLAAAQNVEFLPFVLNVFGGLGPSPLSVVQMICSAALRSYPYRRACPPGQWMARHRDSILQRITVAIGHINNLNITEAVTRSQGIRQRKLFKGAMRLANVKD